MLCRDAAAGSRACVPCFSTFSRARKLLALCDFLSGVRAPAPAPARASDTIFFFLFSLFFMCHPPAREAFFPFILIVSALVCTSTHVYTRPARSNCSRRNESPAVLGVFRRIGLRLRVLWIFIRIGGESWRARVCVRVC